MPAHSLTAEKVVNLIRYRDARAREPKRQTPAGQPALAIVAPFRTLSAREIAHRERMLACLAAATATPSC